MAYSKVLNVDPVMEKPWQRAKRFERYDYWRKSNYPPMSIEPLPLERNRLAGEGMTPEQRSLRKQWVTDQTLHHEPRNIEKLYPKNIFRKIYMWPANKIFLNSFVTKLIGQENAVLARLALPKLVMGYIAFHFFWYHYKYCQRDWTRNSGVISYERKPTFYGEDALRFPDKEKTDFNDRGFKARKALLYKSIKSDEPCLACD